MTGTPEAATVSSLPLRSATRLCVTALVAAAVAVGGSLPAVTPPAAAAVQGPGRAATLAHDWDGDGHADVIARTTSGALLLYPGNGREGFSRSRQIGHGWQGFDQVQMAGDFDGRPGTDVVARSTADATLRLYPGNGRGGFGASRRIGVGWDVFREIVAAGDWDGDGAADLLGLRADDHSLWLYPGNGRGGFRPRQQIGWSWGGLNTLKAVGDWDGDGDSDIVARELANGALWLYPGDGRGRFQAGARRIGVGWGVLTALVAPGDWDGDGRSDLLARAPAGGLVLYRGNGGGGFVSPSLPIGTGWHRLLLGGSPPSYVPLPSFRSSVHTVSTAELGATYRAGCPVAPGDLRRVRVRYYGFDGAAHDGDLVVRTSVAPAVRRVFQRLYDARFPVQRIVPVSQYGGSDDRSMAANNTSAFNCRRTTSGSRWSEHSYGTAIDLNPVQNPYVSRSTVLPSSGRAYVDRSPRRAGMVTRGDVVTRAFVAEGWRWGGDWTSLKDYQHFSLSGR